MVRLAMTPGNARRGNCSLHPCKTVPMGLERWDDVQVFLELYRGGSLTAAAKALRFDVSTASRRLAKLETELDVALFDRTREGLTPTKAATRLLPAAEAMEQAALSFTGEAGVLEREVEGVVSVSAPPGVGESFLGPALPSLAARYPRLRFEVDSSTRLKDVGRREVDLALRTIRPMAGPVVMQLLSRERWVPMAAPALARQLGTVTDWQGLPWIGWGVELAQLHAAKWLAARVKGPPLLRTNSFALQVSALREGLGVALAPEPYAGVHALTPLEVSRRLKKDVAALPVDELWLVAHESMRQVPRVAATWDFLASHFTAAPRPRGA
jgi:DNA-binding transcriptional LysR family regulator